MQSILEFNPLHNFSVCVCVWVGGGGWERGYEEYGGVTEIGSIVDLKHPCLPSLAGPAF